MTSKLNDGRASGRGWTGAGILVMLGASRCALLGGFDLSGYAEGSDAAAPIQQPAATSQLADDATAAASSPDAISPPSTGDTAAPFMSAPDGRAQSAADAAGGAPVDAVSPSDAAHVEAPDAGAPVEGAPDAAIGSDPGIPCGGAFCNPESEVCCTVRGAQSCTSAQACANANGAAADCNDQFDCEIAGAADTACCAMLDDAGTRVVASSCTSFTGCFGAGQNQVILCNLQELASCPQGQSCLPLEAADLDGGTLAVCTQVGF